VGNLTLANQLTILRIMLIPAFVLLLVYGYLGASLLVFAFAGITDALVDIVWDPPWGRDRMSDAAKLQLGMF